VIVNCPGLNTGIIAGGSAWIVYLKDVHRSLPLLFVVLVCAKPDIPCAKMGFVVRGYLRGTACGVRSADEQK